jgi:hypothetical protein
MDSPTRLTASQVKVAREGLLLAQNGRCALCLRIIRKDPVLDHDHHTGAVRGVLHRGCNALLGKVENNYRRYGVEDLGAFLHGAPVYLIRHRENRTGLLHPTHKTEEEKRLARNAAARKRRATKKAQ